MNFRSIFVAFGALSLTGFPAGADEVLNTCNIDIEGATVLMSRDEIAAEWSGRGYVEPPPAPPRRSFSRTSPDPSKSLSFQTADGLPNDRFMSSMGWIEKTHPDINDGQPHYNLITTYQPPADAAKLDDYKQFLREEITSWCEWAAPKVEGQEGGGPERAHHICGQVLAGEFMTTQNGIPAYHPYAAATQTWNGCNWVIRSENDGRLHVTITGPIDPGR